MESDFSKTRKIVQIVLWLATIIWFIVCLYLSWQTGEETSKLSQQITRLLLDLLERLGLEPAPQQFHAGLRLFAHFGVFFIAGFLFCGAAESLWKMKPVRGWVHLLCGATVTLLALLADVPKIWIPGRHLQWSESCLNAAGALAGFLVLYLFTKWTHREKERPD